MVRIENDKKEYVSRRQRIVIDVAFKSKRTEEISPGRKGKTKKENC